ncbi:MAG: hypothetical protein KF726_28300 [Anaerolineae bacterium]|nr:hypothetical protein [Anaerolineae bacterium]
MFHLGDCAAPCWIGIIPGKSSVAEAVTHIQSRFPDSAYKFASVQQNQLRWYVVSSRTDRRYLSIAFNVSEDAAAITDSTIVKQITILTNPASKLTLADWHNLLGQPQGMSVTFGAVVGCTISNPNLLYHSRGIRLTLYEEMLYTEDMLKLDSVYIPVTRLDIFSDIDQLYPPTFRVPWTGIRKSNRANLHALLSS